MFFKLDDMYNIDEIIKIFKRYLKENGEYSILRHTDIVKKLKNKLMSCQMWYDYGMVGIQYGSNPNIVQEQYFLDKFWKYLYAFHNDAFNNEITKTFDDFLTECGVKIQFIDDYNNQVMGEKKIGQFVDTESTINTISDYVAIKKCISPFELVRGAFAWIYTKYPEIDYSRIHQLWFTRMVDILSGKYDSRKLGNYKSVNAKK